MSDRKEDHLNDPSIDASQDNLDSQLPPLPENPRELIENPAVAPQMIETAPEDLRGDLFKDPERKDR